MSWLDPVCLRAGGIRLAMALVLGLLVVPGFLVAPLLFSLSASRAVAGHLAGEIFHTANLCILLLAVILAGFWWRIRVSTHAWFLLATIVVLVGINEFFVSSILADLKLKMGPIDLVPGGDPLRRSFGIWHGISATMHLASASAAAFLVAIGPARKEKFCRPS